MSFLPLHRSRTRLSGSCTGILFSSRPLMALKSAVLAPMPRASEMTTTVVQPLAWSSTRAAWRISRSIAARLFSSLVFHQRRQHAALFVVAELLGGIDVRVAGGAGDGVGGGDSKEYLRRLEIRTHTLGGVKHGENRLRRRIGSRRDCLQDPSPFECRVDRFERLEERRPDTALNRLLFRDLDQEGCGH